jgi:signal transduction histidine kinase
MDNSLDSYTRWAVALVLIVVLSIGGLSLFMAKTMRDKIYLIEEESRNVSLVNKIQAKTNKLIFALQMSILQPEARYDRQVMEIHDFIDPKLHAYIAYEKAATYPEAQEEVRLLKKIDDKLHEIMKVHELVQAGDFSLDLLSKLDQYVTSIEELTEEINQLHFTIIDRKIQKADQRLQIIAILYGFFALLGAVVFTLLYKLYSRHVVSPIKNLAGATRQLASGDLATRLPVESRTEIGLLYHSFNRMAHQIQENQARLHSFNQELEEKVRERTAELENAQEEMLRLERLATLGQVATSVNHEIKTPLNALSMNLQLLKREKTKLCGGPDRDPAAMDATIALLDGEINRISQILDEFVNYARFAPALPEPRDLNRIVAGVVELLSERAAKVQVRIESELAPGLPPVPLDENKIIQALINLGMNALEAMPDGGVLHFRTGRQEQNILLEIRDTGSGIAASDLPRIFDPFFSRKPLGLGFGLAIVQKIVEDHGGRITCHSELQQGTTFTIQLPGQ